MSGHSPGTPRCHVQLGWQALRRHCIGVSRRPRTRWTSDHTRLVDVPSDGTRCGAHTDQSRHKRCVAADRPHRFIRANSDHAAGLVADGASICNHHRRSSRVPRSLSREPCDGLLAHHTDLLARSCSRGTAGGIGPAMLQRATPSPHRRPSRLGPLSPPRRSRDNRHF